MHHVRGRCQASQVPQPSEFADYISGLGSAEAIALGALRRNLPETVRVVTKRRLEKLNGTANSDMIARTSDYIAYEAGCPALALIDIDTKGMPATVGAGIRALGGFWPALVSVLPELSDTGRVVRKSTTTGISRADTGETLLGSNGRHIFLLVQDGADVERFLRTLHDRCWLAGFGWMMVGAGGQLLDAQHRRSHGVRAERLVFEGTPVLVHPSCKTRRAASQRTRRRCSIQCRRVRHSHRRAGQAGGVAATDAQRLAPMSRSRAPEVHR